LELSNVDDIARVYLDGNEILSAQEFMLVKGSDSVNIPISEGTHTLNIEWKEYYGAASIGFSAPQELFEKKGIPGFEPAFLIIAIASIILLKLRNKKKY
jgi:hypothetical protein